VKFSPELEAGITHCDLARAVILGMRNDDDSTLEIDVGPSQRELFRLS
jgi:hypothetical protein